MIATKEEKYGEIKVQVKAGRLYERNTERDEKGN